jgi:hypothetical protein
VPTGLKDTSFANETRAFGRLRRCLLWGEPRDKGEEVMPLGWRGTQERPRGTRAHPSCARERASRTQERLSRVPALPDRHTFQVFPRTFPMEKVHRSGLPACLSGPEATQERPSCVPDA